MKQVYVDQKTEDKTTGNAKWNYLAARMLANRIDVQLFGVQFDLTTNFCPCNSVLYAVQLLSSFTYLSVGLVQMTWNKKHWEKEHRSLFSGSDLCKALQLVQMNKGGTAEFSICFEPVHTV